MEINVLRSMQHFRVISALKPLYTASTIAMFAPPNTCPRGGMVDTRDLKSLGLVGRAGSSPAAGTTCWVIIYLKQYLMVFICEKGTQKEARRNSFSLLKLPNTHFLLCL